MPLVDLLNSLPRLNRETLHGPLFSQVLSNLQNDEGLRNAGKVLFDDEMYPDLPVTNIFPTNDQERAEMAALINEAGFLAEDVSHHLEGNPLAQLLYAYVWKSVSRKKLRPLVEGLISVPIDEVDSGYVFYQFGRHLTDRQQPIVDQHSGRALEFLSLLQDHAQGENALDEDQVVAIRNRGTLGTANFHTYRNWIAEILPATLIPEDREKTLRYLDKSMYILGKLLSR